MRVRRWFVLVGVLALMTALGLGVIVSGCGSTETTTTTAAPTATTAAPTETTATTAAPTDTTAAQPTTEVTASPDGPKVTWKWADQNGPASWPREKASDPWLNSIEKATNGRFTIERFYGQTLMTGLDTWEGLKAGVADMAWCMFQYWAGLAPLAEVVTLPFMPIDTAEHGSEVMWKLYEEFPSIRDEFKDNHLIAYWCSTPYYLCTTKKAVRTVADMKGLKIRALGGPPSQLVEALGGIPVTMPMPDAYQSLQTGVLDGVLTNWESLYSYRHYEVGKYVTLVPFHAGIFGAAANHDSYNKLPDDIKAVLDSKSGMYAGKFWGREKFDKSAAAVKDILKEKNIKLEFIELSPEEIDTAWRQPYGVPLWEAWVKKMESQGHSDAQAILDRALELLKEG